MHLYTFSSSPADARRRLWFALAAFLALFSCLAVAKARLIESVDPGLRTVPLRFWVEKAQGSDTYDLVVLGDSRIYRGVAPSAITEAMGGATAFNMGYTAAGLYPDLLEEGVKRLDPHGERILILGVTPLSLTDYSNGNQTYYDYKSASRLPTLVPQAVSDIFEPRTTETAFNGLLKLLGRGPLKQEGVGYFQIPHADGWVESYRLPEEDPEFAVDLYTEYFRKYPVREEHITALLDAVTELQGRGIRVYAFRPPSSPRMEAMENDRSGFHQEAFISGFQAAGGVWIPIDERESFQSYDGSHLDRDSARRLSRELGEKISTDRHEL